MTTFSSLFQSGAAFYGDPFGPLLDVVTDFGWSLLPQFPGAVGPPKGGTWLPEQIPTPDTAEAPIPVVYEDTGGGIEAATTYVPAVLPRPVAARRIEVPRTVVVVDDVSTEVERHPEGDFPAGSIFAPGQAWEETVDHGLDSPDPVDEEEEVAHDWGHLIRGGISEFLGVPDPLAPQAYYAGNVSGPGPTQIPGGSAASLPSQAQVMPKYANGTDCGNRRYVTLDRETGKISCKRRRRRRLLTNRDLADLASLKTITGGGAALNAAVIRAVR